jgi:hypothetical protein
MHRRAMLLGAGASATLAAAPLRAEGSEGRLALELYGEARVFLLTADRSGWSPLARGRRIVLAGRAEDRRDERLRLAFDLDEEEEGTVVSRAEARYQPPGLAAPLEAEGAAVTVGVHVLAGLDDPVTTLSGDFAAMLERRGEAVGLGAGAAAGLLGAGDGGPAGRRLAGRFEARLARR